MSTNSINNKRIAKNTLVLYVRMIVLMLVHLYTSRLILKVLGVDDFGIYNVVGGFVAMFSLISGSLSNAISRFITFELGKNNIVRLKEVFSSAVSVQILLALGIIFISEIIGIWFLNVKMNIPADRMIAANCVFQCSLLTFAINLISVPYNASIIAHERMTAFAYISILEVLLRLAVVLLLFVIGFDKLIAYAILLVLVATLIRLIYGFYCTRHFEECHYNFTFNKQLVKEMTSLASWNVLGASGNILNIHGVNLLMNLFFGIKVNAARGLAVQVNSAVSQFVTSFTTAVNPQITKSYAQNDLSYTFKLVMMSSKYSFFLMLLIAVPIIVEAPYILQLWLGDVPEYTVLFVRLALIATLPDTLSTSLYTLALATGNIKKYQIVIGSLSLSCFVIVYICYELGASVEYAYYVSILIKVCILFARMEILSGLVGLDFSIFFKNVVLKALVVLIPVVAFAYVFQTSFPELSLFHSFVVIILCLTTTFFSISFLGLSSKEWLYFKSILKKKISVYYNK